MDGYEIINITHKNLSEDEIKTVLEKDKSRCIDYVISLKDEKTIEELSDIWSILTSRGIDKLIYGEMPTF